MVIELVMLLMLVLCILFIGIVGYILLDVKKELKQLKQIEFQQNKETVFISEEFLNIKKDNKNEHETINQQLKLIHETMLSFINQLSLIGKYMKSSHEYMVLMDDESQCQYEELKQWVEDETHLVINEVRQLKNEKANHEDLDNVHNHIQECLNRASYKLKCEIINSHNELSERIRELSKNVTDE